MNWFGIVLAVSHRVAVVSGKRFFALLFGMMCLGLGGGALGDDFSDGMALYHEGKNEEAFTLIKKAAIAGNVEAKYRLSSMYWHGRGVAADYEQAFLWCRQAAFQDHVKAAYALSDMYKKGVVDQDDRQAYYWFRRAAEMDMENGRLAIALMYYRGTLVERDVEKALTWLHKAAEENNITALTMLGIMYETGEYVGQDEARALALFTGAATMEVDALAYRESALKSRSEARYHLARMLEEGRGGATNGREAALKWYEKAAADGNIAAKNRLRDEAARPGRESGPG